MDWRRWGIFALFFASGASGLVYEVVWVREIGILFGSTVYSAALVTGIYMSGLGIGGFLAGRFADRRFRADPLAPLRAYGLFEAGIALLAALVMWALPGVAVLSAQTASYVAGAEGWFVLAPLGSLVRYGLAAALITPITILMGGTLTLLIRSVVADDLAGVGRHVGWLYGVNTAGAALGCLLTDALLVPSLGLRATQWLAVATNALAAAGALWLARSARRRPSPSDTDAAPQARSGEAFDAIEAVAVRFGWVAFSVALGGFAAMAMQIIWFRHLVSIYGGTRAVFSILLTVILCGIWTGSVAAGELERRMRRPALLFAAAVVGFALSALGNLLLLGSGSQAAVDPDGWAGPLPWLEIYGVLLRDVSWSVGIPAFFSGALFPLANAIVQRKPDDVGRRAGALYLANTLGGVLGAFSAGFFWLPRFGVQATAGGVIVLAACSLVGLAAALRRPVPAALPRGVFAAAAAALVVAGASWWTLPPQQLLGYSIPARLREPSHRILAASEGIHETLVVSERQGLWYELLTNGYNMSATTLAAQRYMRAFVHVPALVGRIERVMLMCYGVGNTANAALLHEEVEALDVVDISPDILGHARLFASVNGEPLGDERARVYVNDARHHLRMVPPGSYDLITGEPPPLFHAGVVNLYTREFFELARRALRPGGMLSYWLPVGQIDEVAARAITRAFLDVFPDSVLLAGHGQHLMLLGRVAAPVTFDPARLAQELIAEPEVALDLRAISLDTPAEWAGMLVADAAALRQATLDVAPLRDDHPILEYGGHSFADGARRAPLFAFPEAAAWCPGCGALPEGEQRRIAGHREVLRRYFLRGAFLGGPERFGPKPLSAEAEEALAASFYLQNLLERVPGPQRWARTAARHGRPEDAIRSLEGLLARQPGAQGARRDLADLYRRIRRPQAPSGPEPLDGGEGRAADGARSAAGSRR